MSLKQFSIILISLITNICCFPHETIQINKNAENVGEFKDLLYENLLVTIDNLKTIMILERWNKKIIQGNEEYNVIVDTDDNTRPQVVRDDYKKSTASSFGILSTEGTDLDEIDLKIEEAKHKDNYVNKLKQNYHTGFNIETATSPTLKGKSPVEDNKKSNIFEEQFDQPETAIETRKPKRQAGSEGNILTDGDTQIFAGTFQAVMRPVKIPDLEPEHVVECKVFSALGMILRVLRLLGLAPVKFRSLESDLRASLSEYAHYYGKVFVLALCAVLVYALVLNSKNEEPLEGPDKTSKVIYIVIVTCFILLVMIIDGHRTAKLRMRVTIECLSKIQQITLELYDYRTKENANRKRWLIFFLTLFETIFILTDMSRIILRHNQRVSFTYITTEVYLVMKHMNLCLSELIGKTESVMTNPQIMLLPSLYYHDRTSNELLTRSTVHKINDITIVEPCQHSLSAQSLHKFRLSYIAICDQIRNLDKAYGLVILLSFLAAILNLLVSTYTFIQYLSSGNIEMALITQFINIFIHLSIILQVVEPSNGTQGQINVTMKLVSKMLLNYSFNKDDVMQELDLFYSYVSQPQVSFYPLQMFDIDRDLVIGVLSTIVTYLVIVLNL